MHSWTTDAEKLEIAAMYKGGMSATAIKKATGRAHHVVWASIKFAGVARREDDGTKIPKEESARIIDMYFSGMTIKAIADQLVRDNATIRRAICASGRNFRLQGGLNKSKAHRRYAVDESYFDCIDNERKAWTLGFVSADGSISQGHTIAIGLAEKDTEILHVIANDLKCNRPLCKSVTQYKGMPYVTMFFKVTSLRLANQLRHLGVVENKSLTLKPWEGPSHLMRHYWRGIVDGDGSLAKYRTCKRLGHQFCLVGNQFVCNRFAEYIAAMGIKCRPYQKKGNKAWQVAITTPSSTKAIVTHLYHDATISLQRKQLIANKIMSTNL